MTDQPYRTETGPCGGCDARPGEPCHPYCDYNTPPEKLTNTLRGENAEPAIAAYIEAHYERPDAQSLDHYLHTAAQDMLSDLLHRFDRAHVHPGVLLRQAYNRYREEALGEDPGDQLPVAYALGCQHCQAEPGQPCHWGCESWGLYDHNRHTEPEPGTEPTAPEENGQQLYRYRLDALTWFVGELVAPNGSTARARLRDAIEGVTLVCHDPGVELEGPTIDGDIDLVKVTPVPAPAPASPDADGPTDGPRLYEGLDVFLPHP
ncbi:hypothetical protein [Nonomuraea dietziae]|uniref:hypothetical protein n=1 Tax=Nonomuraea dietziae TaxID=65515 RepID=UPI0033C58033